MIKIIAKIFMLIIIAVISMLTVLLVSTFNLSCQNENDEDYSNWMSKSIDNQKRITDVAMLGAHDAFAYAINLSSKLDHAGLKAGKVPGIFKPPAGTIMKGFIVRQSNTQVSEPEKLLKKGVRYFDVRVSYDSETNKWYTTHSFYVNLFEKDLSDITAFLNSNIGEVLILDFQHVYDIRTDTGFADDNTWKDLVSLLENAGLMKFAHNFSNGPQLSTITFGELTSGKTKNAVIIIGKQNLNDGRILSYDKSIRSNWFNSDDDSIIFESLKKESADIKNNPPEMKKLRIMQAVKTSQVTKDGMIKAITRWSLLDEAARFNANLVTYGDFETFLNELPIVMVDYSDSSEKQFNKLVMEKIISFNKK